jgi:predicted nucleic acid-binding Zn ribbon protein
MQYKNYSNEELGVSPHDCLVCGNEVSEERRDEGLHTCSEKCHREWKRVINSVLQEGLDAGTYGDARDAVIRAIEED